PWIPGQVSETEPRDPVIHGYERAGNRIGPVQIADTPQRDGPASLSHPSCRRDRFEVLNRFAKTTQLYQIVSRRDAGLRDVRSGTEERQCFPVPLESPREVAQAVEGMAYAHVCSSEIRFHVDIARILVDQRLKNGAGIVGGFE